MAKFVVTYNAPDGDSPVVDIIGLRLFDGQAVTVDDVDNPIAVEKLSTNQHFTVTKVAAGRPSSDAPRPAVESKVTARPSADAVAAIRAKLKAPKLEAAIDELPPH